MNEKNHGCTAKGLRHPWLLRLFVAWALGPTLLLANPTGGSVAAGSAAIGSSGNTVTVTQSSDRAVINWGTFSIASGEITKFVQPSSTSAVLNRVLGGQTSIINGTLTANGQVYLVNGNGIVVGPGGMISAGAFTASTRDIADPDFLAGRLHFSGSNSAGVKNLGTITALGGNVVLIGKTVDNRGTIQASQGTAGLVAADDVLLAQRNANGSTITVNPSPTATSAANRIGVHNSGTIAAASAELKAANGNIYALAIQNEGTIRATTAQRQGGRIWLTSDQGTVVNTASGVLDASPAQAGGTGGHIETSGEHLGIAGTVTAGRGGSWLLDPTDVTIDTGGSGTYPDVDATTLINALNGGTDETVTADGTLGDTGTIDVNAALSWTGIGSLILNATNDINFNADVTGPNGNIFATADSEGNGIGNINIAAGKTVSAGTITLSGNTLSVGAGATLAGSVTLTTDAVNWNGTGRVVAGYFSLTTLTKAIELSDTAQGTAGMLTVDSAFLSHVSGYTELDLSSPASGNAIVVDGVSLPGVLTQLVAQGAGAIVFQNHASTFGSLQVATLAGDIDVNAAVTTTTDSLFLYTNDDSATIRLNANLTSAADLNVNGSGDVMVAPNVHLGAAGTVGLGADQDGDGVGNLTLGAGASVATSGSQLGINLGGNSIILDPTAWADAGTDGYLALYYGGTVGIGTTTHGANQVPAAFLAHSTFANLDVVTNALNDADGSALYVGDLSGLTTKGVEFDAENTNANVVFENASPLSFGSLTANAGGDIVFHAGYTGAAGGTVILRADDDNGGDGDGHGSLQVTGGTVSGGGGDFEIYADDVALSGTGALDNGTGVIFIQAGDNASNTGGATIGLGTATGDMTLSNAELSHITAGQLQLTSGASGVGITVAGVNAPTLALRLTATGGSVLVAAGASSLGSLDINSQGIDVAGNLTMANGGGWLADIYDDGTGILTVESGGSVAGGALDITAADINLLGSINLGAAALTITATQNAVTTANATIGVGTATGDMTLSGTELANITAGSLTLTSYAGAGAITVSGVTAAQSANIGAVLLYATGSGGTVVFGPAASSFQGLLAVSDSGIVLQSNLSSVSDIILDPGTGTIRIAEGASPTVTSSAGALSFSGPVDGTTGGAAESLTVSAAGGITFQGAVGHANDPDGLASLTISSASTVTFIDTLDLAGTLTQSAGTGLTTFDSAANVGAFQLTGQSFDLEGALTASAASAITAAEAVSGQGLLTAPQLTLSVGAYSSLSTALGTLVLNNVGVVPLVISEADDLNLSGSAGGSVYLTAGGAVTLTGALSLPGELVLTTGGNVTQASGADLTAAVLSLSGTGATTLENAGNQIGAIAYDATGGDLSLRTNGTLTVNGITNHNGKVKLVVDGTGSDLVLNGAITAIGTGATVILSTAGTFHSGTFGINAGAGNWQVWSGDPSLDSTASLAPNFIQYDATYGTSAVLGTGNGLFYTLAPTVSFSLIGTAQRTYDATTAIALGAANLQVSGAVNGDTLVAQAAGTYDTKDVGTGKTVTANGITFTGTHGSATVYGYQAASTGPISAAIGTVTQAPLTVGGLSIAQKNYDGTTAATLFGTGVLDGLFGGDSVGLDVGTPAASFADANPGVGKTALITGYGISGADVGDYYLVQPTASATIIGVTNINHPFTSIAQFSAQTQASPAPPTPSTLARPSFNASLFSVPAPGAGAPPVYVAQGNQAAMESGMGGALAFGSSYRRGQGQ